MNNKNHSPKRWHYHNLNRMFWINSIRKVVPHLPDFIVTLARYLTITICFFYMTKERRAMLSNLFFFTKKPLIKRVWLAFKLLNKYAIQLVAFSIHDKFSDDFWKLKVQENMKYQTQIQKALKMGRGLILISAHLGCWEFGKHVLAMKNTKVNMVMVPAEDNSVEDYWNDLRSREGLSIINLKASPFASIEILSALENNEIVVLHGDRIMNKNTAKCNFFGKEAYFPTGPVELARISKAPVLAAFIIIEKGGNYRVIVDDSIKMKWTGNRNKDVFNNLQQIVSLLEKYVSKYPTQFYAFYDFWRKPDFL